MHRVTVSGRQLLHYPAPVIDVAVLRGTTADVAGNIGFEREAVLGDSLNQVLRLSRTGSCTELQLLLDEFMRHCRNYLHQSRCTVFISLLERQQGSASSSVRGS